MKIAFFTESYKPYLSGVTVSIDTLAKALENLGHEIKIFCPMYPGHRERGPKVFRFRSFPSPYPEFRLAIPFSRKILPPFHKHQFDIIHSHTPYQLGLLSLRLAKRDKIPYVYTFHTLFTEYLHHITLLSPKITKPLMMGYLRRFLNRCDRIIAPTAQVKELLLKEKVLKPLEIIHTGVDLELIASASAEGIKTKHQIPQAGRLLLYVGRLSREKNIPFLLDAFKKVAGKKSDVYLMIVAEGPKRKEHEKMAGERVIFAGKIPPPEIFNYFKAADLFVFSSKTETQGLVLAEANAAGLPIVALASPVIEEMVENGRDGFITEENRELFSQKILQLLEDENLRRSMSEKALISARRFSAEEMARKMEAVYKTLL